MVLVADNRIESLYKKIDVFININQPNKDHYILLGNLIFIR